MPQMDNSYFGFSESPFADSRGNGLLFLSKRHEEIFGKLADLLKGPDGFAVVSGEAGSGKTTLINGFLSRLPESVQAIIIANPAAGSAEIMHEIATALQAEMQPDDYFDLNEFEEALIEARRNEKYVMLVVDDAHLLSDQGLEAIWLFSNIERNAQKLLKILLVGQEELNQRLAQHKLKHLSPGITLSCQLAPLSPHETMEYISQRLEKAGSSFDACFEPGCHDLLVEITGGLPQRINQACDKALQACMDAGISKINPHILGNLARVNRTGLFSGANIRGHGRPWLAIALGVGMLTSIGFFGFMGLPGNGFQKMAQKFYFLGRSSADTPGPNPATITPGNASPQDLKAPGSEGKAPLKPEKSETPGPGISETSLQPKPVSETKKEAEKLESSSYRITKEDKSLTSIAARRYPGHEKMGIEAIILANPEIANENLIYPGQILHLPQIDFADNRIRWGDGLFYAPYGRYYSPLSLQRDLAWLEKEKVRYVVRKTRGTDGRTLHRVFLGGYETEGDLQEVQKGMVKKSK